MNSNIQTSSTSPAEADREPVEISMIVAFDNQNRTLIKKSLSCLIMSAMMIIVLWAWTGIAYAHSTEGRVKVPLDQANPTYDDFAYFIEPYVNQEKYKGVHKPHTGRFYPMDNDEMTFETTGREALATFEVLDVRGDKRFMDTMRFVRGDDGIWRYMEAEGGPREVYTYIPRSSYIMGTYIQPAAMIGLPLLLVFLVVLRLKKKRNAKIFASKKPRIKA